MLPIKGTPQVLSVYRVFLCDQTVRAGILDAIIVVTRIKYRISMMHHNKEL
jgi:hypothetical protein